MGLNIRDVTGEMWFGVEKKMKNEWELKKDFN